MAAPLALAVFGACAAPYQGEDDAFDRGEASAAPPRKDGGGGGATGGSSGSRPGDGGGPLLPDADTPDSGPVAVACDPGKGVGAIVDVPGLVNASDLRAEARFSADELHVVFTQVRNPQGDNFVHDIYTASRTARDQPFGQPKAVAIAQNVFNASLSPDGLTLYFTPKNAGLLNGLQVATRATPDADFGAATVLGGAPQGSYDPFATTDGRLLFSQYPQEAPSTIQVATVVGGSLTGIGTFFGVSNTDVDYPSLSSDGVELFYTAYVGQSFDAVFRRATRQGDGSYAGATALGGLDEVNQEVTWVSADACRVYMTDWRGYQLRMAVRLP